MSGSYDDGYADGYENGYSEGQYEGYDDGYRKGVEELNFSEDLKRQVDDLFLYMRLNTKYELKDELPENTIPVIV